MPDRPPATPFPETFPETLAAPPRSTPVRVVVADDNPVVRAGLGALLSGVEDITVVAEAADGRQAYEAALHHRPDLVLLDVRMPDVDGLAALPHLVRVAPVMMLTHSSESEVVQEALRRGAGGYLVHGEFTVTELLSAIRDIVAGRAHFTPAAATAVLAHLRSSDATAHGDVPSGSRFPESYRESLSHVQPIVGQSEKRCRLSVREAEIMDLIAAGLTNQQIAAACFISEKTVKNHINRIFAKLHSTSRSEAAAKWLGTAVTP